MCETETAPGSLTKSFISWLMGLIIKLASIFYDKAGIQFFDGPRRREAAGGHKPKINFAYWRISYRSCTRAGVAVMDAASLREKAALFSVEPARPAVSAQS